MRHAIVLFLTVAAFSLAAVAAFTGDVNGSHGNGSGRLNSVGGDRIAVPR